MTTSSTTASRMPMATHFRTAPRPLSDRMPSRTMKPPNAAKSNRAVDHDINSRRIGRTNASKGSRRCHRAAASGFEMLAFGCRPNGRVCGHAAHGVHGEGTRGTALDSVLDFFRNKTAVGHWAEARCHERFSKNRRTKLTGNLTFCSYDFRALATSKVSPCLCCASLRVGSLAR